jgi:hypothetical protein
MEEIKKTKEDLLEELEKFKNRISDLEPFEQETIRLKKLFNERERQFQENLESLYEKIIEQINNK